MKLMNVKGTFDYMPKEMNLRNKIMATLRRNFEKYGYLPIETPKLNYFDLLSYKYDDDAEILNEIYHLTDQGDRELGLRYDLTVPFCKVVGMNKGLSLPFRRYEMGPVFRNGPVKLGRTREFYQCDVDVVGIDNRFIEAEQILMAINTYKELGIDIFVRYNNRKLMSGLILEAGIEEDLVSKVIGIIDKKEKVKKEDLILMLEDISISKESIDKLLAFFDQNLDDYKKLNNPLIKEGLDEILELQTYLKELNILDDCLFTPTLARGLSIYTGIVFEFYDKKMRLSCAIGAGGRYNKIITNFMNNGMEYPAVGLSFGLEPIFVILSNEIGKESLIDVLIVPLDTDCEALNLANVLREKNIKVLIEMTKKKVGKCFEYAERENIKYVMILGSNEINNGIYKIKDMQEKVEYSYNLEDLIKFLIRE